MTDIIGTSDDSIRVLESPKIPIIPFALTLSDTGVTPLEKSASLLIGNNGIVGTITLLQNCVIVWVGWGQVMNGDNDDNFSEYEFGSGKPQQVSRRAFLNRFIFFC